MFADFVQAGLVNPTSSMQVFSIPLSMKLVRVNEVPNYRTSSFIGEIGGYLGLILGLSFWGIYGVAKDVIVIVKEKCVRGF